MQEKLNALIIFGWEFRWEAEFVIPLQKIFVVQKFYFFPSLKEQSYKNLIESLNLKIRDDSIDVVLFNVDFHSNIDYIFINSIAAEFKFVFSHDDPTLHVRNSMTCLLSQIHMIIVSDALSVLKYRALGFEAKLLPLEGGGNYCSLGGIAQRPVDVLFIGNTEKADRAKIISALHLLGINVQIEGGSVSNLDYAQMILLYQSAKIVLNFSKSDQAENASLEMGLYGYLLETKGRLFEAGLCGALCISEYAPFIDILFKDGLVPTFHTPDQCAKIVAELLANPQLLEIKRAAFAERCEELRPENIVSNWQLNYRTTTNWPKEVPYWYLLASFFDRFRWALICRRPADICSYIKELNALRSPLVRKLWLLYNVWLSLMLHFVKFIKRKYFVI